MTRFFDFEWDDNYTEGTYTRGDLRAVLTRDPYPDAPYFEAGDPILDSVTGERVYGAPVDPQIIRAFDKALAGAWQAREWEADTFERYVRIFHGGTVRWLNGGSRGEEGRYAVLALPEVRRELGVPEQYVNAAPTATEWQAYVEGNVYGVRVERRMFEETILRDLDGREVERRDREVWTPTDFDVWGHYGDQYAVQAAMEALDAVSDGVVA